MKHITEFLNNFKINLKLKKNIFITKKTKLLYQLAKTFKLYGYITNIFIIKINNKNLMVIYIDYKINPLVTTIKQIYSFNIPLKTIFLNYNKLNKLNKTEFIILSTHKGILSGQDAYNLKVGGKLLCSIK
nr:ribosomal protein S8 [Coccidia sp. AB-2023a]